MLLIEKVVDYVDGYTYKNIRLVSKLWLFESKDQIDKFSNHLWTLINKFPHEDWNWKYITSNRNTSWQKIQQYPHRMNIGYICKNENALAYYLTNSLKWHKHLPILFSYMSRELICQIPKCDWKIFYISKNKNLTWNFFYKYKRPWDWYEIFQFVYLNQNILDFLKNSNYISLEYLSVNPYITWEFISTNPRIPWNWYFLSKNLNITWSIILQFLSQSWDWNELSVRKDTTWEIIYTNLYLPWNWDWISANPNITFEIITTYPQYPWNWVVLSSVIPINTIIKNPQFPWDWDEISGYNHSITWRIIDQNLQLPWNWTNISFNTFCKPGIFSSY